MSDESHTPHTPEHKVWPLAQRRTGLPAEYLRERMTLAQVRKLPATVDVSTAACALGIGRSTLYDAIRLGQSPVKTLTIQRRVVVLTADLVRVLEGSNVA